MITVIVNPMLIIRLLYLTWNEFTGAQYTNISTQLAARSKSQFGTERRTVDCVPAVP
jgi:hypothetical protein